ncbi:MAG: hypothetical protein IKU39_07360 [Lachnospiraceae bacterium]|nr:hypothetical protein [Lachnospiraceae bacterium]
MTLFMAAIAIVAEFTLLTFILFIVGWVIERILGCTVGKIVKKLIPQKIHAKSETSTLARIVNGSQSEVDKFSLSESVVAYLCFLILWFLSISFLGMNGYFLYAEIYWSFVVFGVFSVIWCNFSWKPEKTKKFLCVAYKSVRDRKRLVIYLLLAVFSLVLGYYQMMVTFIPLHAINPIFSLFNLATVAAITALDRVLNQIFQIAEKEELNKDYIWRNENN